IFERIESYLESEGFTIKTPLKDIPEEVMNVILYGNSDMEVVGKNTIKFDGVINVIGRHSEESSAAIQRWAQSFMNQVECDSCHGARLKKEALFFKIADKNIGELAAMDLSVLNEF